MNKKEWSKFVNSSFGDKVFIIMVYVVLTAVFLIVVLPLIYIVSASFSDPQAVVSGKVFLLPVNPTLRGYAAVFKNTKIMNGFFNSIIYTAAGVVVNLVMTMLCAYPLSRREFMARNKLAMLFVFTMYFSGGLVPTYMVVQKLGLIDSRLAMIIPSAMSTYNMIICRTYMVNSIPDEMYEAASIDGCTPFKYLLRIVTPLCKPILAVLTLYYGVAKWNSYFDAMLYLKDQKLQPLTIIMREILIQNQIDYTMISDVSSVAAQRGLTDLLKYSTIVVASLPVLLIYPFVQKHFVKGVMIGAVKG